MRTGTLSAIVEASSVLLELTRDSALGNRWNFGLCLHVPNNSSCSFRMRLGFFRMCLNMWSFSWLHNRQPFVPKVLTVLSGLPCQRIFNVYRLRMVSGVGVGVVSRVRPA